MRQFSVLLRNASRSGLFILWCFLEFFKCFVVIIRNDRRIGSDDISDEVFQTCKAQGYMFDPPEIITHDEYMKRLAKIVCSINPNDVAGAFLYSLSTRSLEYRSALGSYWYAVAVPNHQWPDDKPYHCPICGWQRYYYLPLCKRSACFFA